MFENEPSAGAESFPELESAAVAPQQPAAAQPIVPPPTRPRTVLYACLAFVAALLALGAFLYFTSGDAEPDTFESSSSDSLATAPAAAVMPHSPTVGGVFPTDATSLDTYKIVYTVNGGVMSMLDLNVLAYQGEYRRGTDTKIVSEITVGANSMTTEVYGIGGLRVVCSDEGYASDSSCEIVKGSSYGESMMESVNNLIPLPKDAQNLGTAVIAGRQCTRRAFDFTNSSFGDASSVGFLFSMASILESGRSSEDARQLHAEVCVDQESALLLALNVSVSQTSKLTGITTLAPILSYQAISFTTEVPASEFELPMNALSSIAGCNNDKSVFVITSLVDAKLPVTVSSYTKGRFDENKTVTSTNNLGVRAFKKGQSIAISIPSTQKLSDYTSLQYELCVGTNCSELSCYSSALQSTCFENAANKTACEARTDCLYVEPLCQEFNCYSLRDKDSCAAYASCGWVSYGTSGMCSTKYCTDYTSQSLCTAVAECYWTGTACDYSYKRTKDSMFSDTDPVQENKVAPARLVSFSVSGIIDSVNTFDGSSTEIAVGDAYFVQVSFDPDQNASTQQISSISNTSTFKYSGSGATKISATINGQPWNLSDDAVMEIYIQSYDWGQNEVLRYVNEIRFTSTDEQGNRIALYLTYSGGGLTNGVQLPTQVNPSDWLGNPFFQAISASPSVILRAQTIAR